MNKALRVVLALLICVNLLWGIHPYAFAQTNPVSDGDITAEAPAEVITLSDAEDFLEFSENCRLNSYSYNLIVQLDADIDLSDTDFECIPSFSGTFEGGGHTITGLSITTNGSVQGLFRYLHRGSVVRDLTVEGQITPGGSHSFVGGIAGINYGSIENCRFSGKVSGSERVGGLVGTNELTGIIDSCIAAGDIHADHFAGGIAGENKGVVRGCENKAHVNATAAQNSVDISDITIDSITGSEAAGTATDIGGIAGTNSGVVRQCRNRGTIGYPHIGYNVGGIAGSQIGYITGCENFGDIYGRKEAGGIVGQMEPSTLIQYAEDALQTLHGQLQDMSVTIDGASAAVQNGTSQISGQAGELQGHIDTALDAMGQLAPDGSGNPPDSDSTLAALNNLSGAMSSINGTVNNMASAGQDSVQELTDQLGKLLEDINSISTTIGNAANNVGGTVADVSDNDTDEDTSGKVENCINNGSVDADVNAGGIVGAMSVENDLDPEDDFVSVGSSSVNFDCEIRAVVVRCENHGEVTAKRQSAGGIAGWSSLGLIRDCSNAGTLYAPAAKYVGGISGLSSGYIRGCDAKCPLTGIGYVGGIAGQTNGTVTDCTSMVSIDGASEKYGAVLGSCEELARGRGDVPVIGNYYLAIDRDIGGVDGISYDGAAQSMEREEFFGREDLPDIFDSVTVRFVFDDDREIHYTLSRGESLDIGDIPQIPEKPGYVGYWDGLDRLDLSLIPFDTTLTLAYESLDSAIQSSAVRDNHLPLMLALGEFSPEEQLNTAALTDLDRLSDDTEFIEGWEFTLSGNGTIDQLRLLLPDGIDAESIGLSLRGASGEWLSRGFTADGSYIVFHPEEGETAFRLDTVPKGLRTEHIIAAASVLLLLITVVFIIRQRKKEN
ncbi:MAG: hypothetical protein E7554_06335 [Ruminococcaceae bacterium]|nr:hypothetical protein [Oscillospiraceae bacterium]